MKTKICLMLFLLLSSRLVSINNVFENQLKTFYPDEIQFYLGDIESYSPDMPNFSIIPDSEWKYMQHFPYHNLTSVKTVWFRLNIAGLIIPINSIYFHSLDNSLKIYYPKQIETTSQESHNLTNLSSVYLFNTSIIRLFNNDKERDFNLNYIYFSLDIENHQSLFKFFPVIVGEENSIRDYVVNEEIVKRNTRYLTFFIGNFLFFVSLITLIIFIITYKNLNLTILFFTLFIASAGFFYLLLSPLSIIFTNLSNSRMNNLTIFFHLIWFFFGLLISSFLKKKWLSLFSLIILINLILTIILPQVMFHSRFFIILLLNIFNLLIVFYLKKSQLDFLQTESIFSLTAIFNVILFILPLFFHKAHQILMIGPLGLGLFAWVISFAYYTYKQYVLTMNELQTQKIRNLELTESNLESQLNSLKKQLDPHFLFNSLGTLVALIEIDKDTAINYIQEFSQMYRYILETHEKNFVTLSEELNFCQSYIFLLEKRLDNSINISVSIDDSDLPKYIPPLSIQALIENAVKHNIATENTPLKIDLFSEDNMIIVRNIINPKPQKIQSPKLGLKNLNQRLFLLKHVNIIIVESANYFEVKIPLISDL